MPKALQRPGPSCTHCYFWFGSRVLSQHTGLAAGYRHAADDPYNRHHQRVDHRARAPRNHVPMLRVTLNARATYELKRAPSIDIAARSLTYPAARRALAGTPCATKPALTRCNDREIGAGSMPPYRPTLWLTQLFCARTIVSERGMKILLGSREFARKS